MCPRTTQKKSASALRCLSSCPIRSPCSSHSHIGQFYPIRPLINWEGKHGRFTEAVPHSLTKTLRAHRASSHFSAARASSSSLSLFYHSCQVEHQVPFRHRLVLRARP